MTVLSLRIEPPAGAPIERECQSGPVSFGRAPGADVVVRDDSMSRQHARIRAEGDDWVVEDLRAYNGTFVNGERVEGMRRLEPGDVIKMGATLVRVKAGPSSGAPSPAGLAMGSLGSSIFKSVAEITSAERSDPAPTRVSERLKALNDFHRALAGPISLDALLELLLDQLFAVLHPEEGVILLRKPDGTLATAASRRPPNATGELVVSRRLTDEVVEKGTAALVFDLAVDERFAHAQSMIGAGIRSILAAPISDAAGCVGMVAIYSRAQVRRFGEEDLELLVSLASAAALRIRNVELAEEAAARRVQDRELALAHDIQMAMLPRQMPHRAEIEMAATLIPARAVGGDLYDFIVMDDALWFVVADAAGKGVSAALFMAVTRTLFRAIAHSQATTSSATARMNAELARDNEQQFFVTALVGRIDLRTGEFTYSNAGHLLPLHVPSGGVPVTVRGAEDGIALGILEDAEYAEGRLMLGSGDLLMVFTDGVTEAVDASGRLFSDERLARVLASSAAQSSQAVVDAVVGAVTTFAGTTPQEDDITVLALRFTR
jgi:phosphoserine phosphatase RsbU/P